MAQVKPAVAMIDILLRGVGQVMFRRGRPVEAASCPLGQASCVLPWSTGMT
jgi:hypothetical protein